MSGVLARLVAQTVVFVAGVATKAFVAALAKAQAGGAAAGGAAGRASSAAAASAGGAAASGRMALDQARLVLNLEKSFTRDEVQAQFDKYFKANDPDAGGSFYVQSKVVAARETLVAELRRLAAAGGGGGSGGDDRKAGSSSGGMR